MVTDGLYDEPSHVYHSVDVRRVARTPWWELLRHVVKGDDIGGIHHARIDKASRVEKTGGSVDYVEVSNKALSR